MPNTLTPQRVQWAGGDLIAAEDDDDRVSAVVRNSAAWAPPGWGTDRPPPDHVCFHLQRQPWYDPGQVKKPVYILKLLGHGEPLERSFADWKHDLKGPAADTARAGKSVHVFSRVSNTFVKSEVMLNQFKVSCSATCMRP
jgi:hypothetical protein